MNLSLGFTPPTGTNLKVVNNTGIGFITGQFSNLTQGQVVNLSYGGKSYRFVANYYGGTGNDLVLQWAYQDLAAWGDNSLAQLGNNGMPYSRVPALVAQSGVLAGKTVVSVAAGSESLHSLALCSDGTVAAWGNNSYGQLGNNSTTTSGSVPVLVTQSGVLAGKTVVSVTAGGNHSLALCSDGTLAAWGNNHYGQLGNNSTTDSSVPVLVTQSGVLAGKTVVSIAAGGSHCLALCSDGTVAAWGYNVNGQLGTTTTTTQSSVPVLVTRSGVLAGKIVVSLAAGGSHSLALCSDGTLAAWGYNLYGELGNNSTWDSSVPVLVTQSSGVLAGKTVVSIAAGSSHCLALCSDGTVAAWGSNVSGELGNNSTWNSSVPGLVTQSSEGLAGKTVVSVVAGEEHSMARCSDGTVVAWGSNNYGQLGNDSTTQSNVPLRVMQGGVLYGKTVVSIAAGAIHSLALCSDGTVAAWGCNSLGNNRTTESSVPVLVTQSGVLAGKTVVSVAAGEEHCLALCSDGTVAAWGNNSNGQLGNNSITVSTVPVQVTQSGVLTGKIVVSVAAGRYHSLALCSDGTVAAWGYNQNGQLGNNSTTDSSVPVLVTQSGVLAGKIVVSVAAGGYHSLALCSDGTVAAWGYGEGGLGQDSSVPVLVSQNGVLAGKTVVSIAAGYSQSLALCSDGTVAAWGGNVYGQLGNNSTTNSVVPVLVTQSGVLAGKTVISVAAGEFHSLALCSDGTLAAWGNNSYGQLGNNSTNYQNIVPVLVTQSGVLAGKTVVSVVAGDFHSLALCSDGTVVAWGYNNYGQLGNNSTTNCSVPVLVKQSGMLAGKSVVSLAAGESHSLALASVPNSPDLSGLSLSSGTLSPSFDPATTSYSARVSNVVSSITVTPTSAVNSSSISVNGSPVTSGLASQTISLVGGANTITIVVTAPDGITTKTYTVIVTQIANYSSWLSSYPGLSDASPSGDPDHDGIPNLLEYVLNGNPGTASTAILPSVTKVANNYVFTFSRLAASAQDSTQVFQYSTDLSHWTDVMITSPIDAKVLLGATDSNGVQTVTVTIPAGKSATMFGRLNVFSATAGLSGYSAWISTYNGLSDTTHLGDPDHDGVPNLLEYVLNGNPGISSPAILPVMSKVPSKVVFTFSRRVASAQDTTQVFQYSTDLSHWTDVMITSPTDAMVSLGVADANGVQTVTVTIPQGASATMFGRLKVLQP